MLVSSLKWGWKSHRGQINEKKKIKSARKIQLLKNNMIKIYDNKMNNNENNLLKIE